MAEEDPEKNEDWKQGRAICYLAETWVSAGHSVKKVFTDTTFKSTKQDLLNELSMRHKNPSGKDKLLFDIHKGSEMGVLEEGLLSFESKYTKDRLEEMDGATFEEWFVEVLPCLEVNAVIVMDSELCHTVMVDEVPNKSLKKTDIQDFLSSHNVPYEDNYHIPASPSFAFRYYEVDTMAALFGRVRLPPTTVW